MGSLWKKGQNLMADHLKTLRTELTASSGETSELKPNVSLRILVPTQKTESPKEGHGFVPKDWFSLLALGHCVR